MMLADLSHEQQLALVGLLEEVAVSGGVVSDAETKAIGKVAEALGADNYRQLLDEAETRFTSQPEFQTFLATIEDQQARELIYGTVLQESMADMSAESLHSQLLHWLQDTWGVSVTLQE